MSDQHARRRRRRRSISFARSSPRTWPPASTDGRVATRFPPEPNGYLHIGHAKSICLNFGIAEETGGTCNLRFDDTNPDQGRRRVRRRDQGRRRVARVHVGRAALRVRLLRAALSVRGRADQAGQGLRRQPDGRRDSRPPRHADRAGPQQPVSRPAGRREPRSVRADARRRVPGRRARAAREDRHGVAELEHARSDAVPDPPRRRTTGPATTWCIYPMYDFAHPLSDALERITHSLCTLEFEDHRPLYDWLVEQLCSTRDRPQQIEFARLNLNYTVMSKRKLLQLVQQKHVAGLGRSAHADDHRPAPPRLHARSRSATSARGSAWRRRKTSSTSRSSSTACARI